MRFLTPNQKQKAAAWLGIAHSHLRSADQLSKGDEYAAPLSRLYYAAHFSARAALAEKGLRSEKHTTWNGAFNKEFGRGAGWVPALYARTLIELEKIREKVDYEGSYPSDSTTFAMYRSRTSRLLKKVISHTPLCYYSEFVAEFIAKHPEILAIEFDYYCPKSYIHKERLQYQVMAEKFSTATTALLSSIGKGTMNTIQANRPEDYVLGWNNRLGQASDAYLIFLDIDEEDEGRVKNALAGLSGWLFKSGNGYHFVGKVIFPTREKWLAKLQAAHKHRKLEKVLDDRYRDFSERRGYSTLRVEGSPVKDFKPFLCWESS